MGAFVEQEALGLLNIRHHFKGVYGAKGMGDTCKPDPKAFQGVLEDIGADPKKTGELGGRARGGVKVLKKQKQKRWGSTYVFCML